MTYTEHKITLDIHKTVSSVSLRVKKMDTGRRLLIYLAEKGTPYHVDDDCYAVFTARKPDGKVVFNNCRIEKCVIIYDFTEQTVAVSGMVECEIILYGSDGKQLTSASFNIIVEDTIYDTETDVESTSEYNALTDLIAKVQAIHYGGALASAVVCAAEGEQISVSDASNHPVQGLRIFGKSTLDGTPTIETPVEIVSVEAPVITVTDGTEVQTVTVTTPGSLCGIPVASGGNYTDSEGQQWICDEVDLARGVYVQRIGIRVFDGVNYPFKATAVPNVYSACYVDTSEYFASYECNNALSTMYPLSVVDISSSALTKDKTFMLYRHIESSVTMTGIMIHDTAFADAEEVNTFFAENPLRVIYALRTPVETALTKEENAAFAALHTYKPNTTIYNDAGAYMAMEYAADTKTYIDVASGSAAGIGEVTLRAAGWVGEDSPYSQVVEIEGVTENSQVDLTPSVEQLSAFYHKDLAFVTENDGGVVTVYAIGQKPENDYTIQVTITEVYV